MMTTPDSSDLPERATARPPAFLVGDHLALDFLNTIAAPKGAPIEWLASGRDLLDWLTAVGVVDAGEAARLAARWDGADLDAVAREAVELREWFRGVVMRIKERGHGALTADDLGWINGMLARNVSVRRLEPGDGAERCKVVERMSWTHPRELLAPVAAAMAELVSEGDFGLIRRCENQLCTMWFYDRTKGHRRRWCSQSMCGNRAKVAAFRLRKRLAG